MSVALVWAQRGSASIGCVLTDGTCHFIQVQALQQEINSLRQQLTASQNMSKEGLEEERSRHSEQVQALERDLEDLKATLETVCTCLRHLFSVGVAFCIVMPLEHACQFQRTSQFCFLVRTHAEGPTYQIIARLRTKGAFAIQNTLRNLITDGTYSHVLVTLLPRAGAEQLQPAGGGPSARAGGLGAAAGYCQLGLARHSR